MKNGKRIFIGIELSDAARRAAAEYISGLRKEFPSTKVGWERPEKLHITLKFIGDVESSLISKVEREIRRSIEDHRPIDLTLEKIGVFPNEKKPRILWIGATEIDRGLSRIEANLSENLEKLGFKKEKRGFIPHLTIGRIREPERAVKLAETHIDKYFEPVAFDVSEIAIFESKLQPTGSIYKILERIPISF